MPETDVDVTEKFKTSVTTGRDLDGIAKGLKSKKKTAKALEVPQANVWTRSGAVALPKFQPPQLATLVDTVPTGDNWVFELKYDGYRAVAALAGPEVRVYTRTGKDWTDTFHRLREPLSQDHQGLGPDRRRDLRLQRRRQDRLRHPAGSARHRRPARLLRLRPPRTGRRGPPKAPADRAQGAAQEAARARCRRMSRSSTRTTSSATARRSSTRSPRPDRKASSPRTAARSTSASGARPGSRSKPSSGRSSSSAAGARPTSTRASPRC